MPDISHAQKARARKRLDTKFRYEGGVMTEREFVESAFREGATCKLENWTDYGTDRRKTAYMMMFPDKTLVEVSKAAFDHFNAHSLVQDFGVSPLTIETLECTCNWHKEPDCLVHYPITSPSRT